MLKRAEDNVAKGKQQVFENAWEKILRTSSQSLQQVNIELCLAIWTNNFVALQQNVHNPMCLVLPALENSKGTPDTIPLNEGVERMLASGVGWQLDCCHVFPMLSTRTPVSTLVFDSGMPVPSNVKDLHIPSKVQMRTQVESCHADSKHLDQTCINSINSLSRSGELGSRLPWPFTILLNCSGTPGFPWISNVSRISISMLREWITWPCSKSQLSWKSSALRDPQTCCEACVLGATTHGWMEVKTCRWSEKPSLQTETMKRLGSRNCWRFLKVLGIHNLCFGIWKDLSSECLDILGTGMHGSKRSQVEANWFK